MPDAAWLVQQCLPNSTRPSSVVEERIGTLFFTYPDFILHFSVAKGIRIIEGSPRAVVRKEDKRC